ncbi:flagellar biosynthesis protein FlhF [Spongiibacter sp. KMU-158]|uniref:Flagellar biosynthesis protein FlhF n=1 Tax=Spongiibacter pelagi TaxID=2760804 RepID=A0A927C230_9GAMM|nr:flagellar biosynthesis protein FlhF [Spongiibacter pelagi]MBD2858447.1 flagellar biosynthesis protein FlhF [Spongiibacter pelagi]
MNVKKYRAANSDQAMRMIRRAHGSDVAILDCYNVPGGVEVVVSLDEISTAPLELPNSQASFKAHMNEAREHEAQADSISSAAAKGGEQKANAIRAQLKQQMGDDARSDNAVERQTPQLAWSQDQELLAMKQELAAMKSMLLGQLKEQDWHQASQKQPAQRELNRFMEAIDLDPAVARNIAKEIPEQEDIRLQREMLKALLINKLPIMTPPSRGAIAFVGPQGAGKTTTIAKIATQHVMRHGRDDIAILTADMHRVGAQEQLRAYGNILQIPVYSAASNEEAAKTFRLLQNKSLVLVDTTGLSFRDKAGLTELENLLGQLPGVNRFLVLPSDSEAYVQSEIINAYSALSPSGAVLSRLDETMRLGASLSNLIQHRLPVVWCSNGPKVPNNLSSANAEKLVNLAIKMARPFEVSQSKETTSKASGSFNAFC